MSSFTVKRSQDYELIEMISKAMGTSAQSGRSMTVILDYIPLACYVIVVTAAQPEGSEAKSRKSSLYPALVVILGSLRYADLYTLARSSSL